MDEDTPHMPLNSTLILLILEENGITERRDSALNSTLILLIWC